jgi:hypothetical protein
MCRVFLAHDRCRSFFRMAHKLQSVPVKRGLFTPNAKAGKTECPWAMIHFFHRPASGIFKSGAPHIDAPPPMCNAPVIKVLSVLTDRDYF